LKRLGKVDDGNTVSDFQPEEIKKKITISSTIVPVNTGIIK
jgi:elongation factor G